MRNAFLVLLAVLTLSLGCATESGPELDSEGLRPPAGSGKADGIGPEGFFAQFRYSEVEEGGYWDDGQPMWTRHAGSYDARILLEGPDGTVEVGFDLWMLDDGQVYADYEESRRLSGSSSEVTHERITLTQWRVEGEALMIEGVGVGEAAEVGELPVIRFTFDQDVHTEGLAGQTVTLYRVGSSYRLELIERDFEAQG